MQNRPGVKLFWVRSLFLCLILFFPASSYAQFLNTATDPSLFSSTISQIDVRGNETVSTDAVLNLMSIKPGKPFTKKEISSDIKSLFSSGFFRDVQIGLENQTILVVNLKEKATINSILYLGFNEVTPSSLKDKITSKQYNIVSEKKLSQDLHTIEQAYADKGYYLAKANYTLQEVQKGTVDVVFQVQENQPVAIRRVNLIGNEYFNDQELQSFMGTKPYSWLSFFDSAGLFKDEYLSADQQNLTYFYRDNGYAEATAATPLAYMDASRSEIDVSFYIEEGERFHVGKINISGDLVETEEEIKKKLTLQEGKWYRISRFNNDMKILKNIYGDKGYAFAYIYPSFHIDRKNRIYDITYTVTKKEKAYFRNIIVEGNIKTRENVILRGIKVSPGELYNATRIEKSKFNLSRLEYFSNVDVLQNADEPNHAVDLRVMVKEKSTGKLSASVGASPNTNQGSGPTFFGNFQYNETNFIGRGYGLGSNIQVSPSPAGPNKLNYILGINFSNPSVYDSLWNMGISGNYSYQIQNETTTSSINQVYITQKKISAGTNVGREVVENTRMGIGYVIADTETDPSNPLVSQFYASGKTEEVSQSLVFDNTDSNDMPTKGFHLVGSNTIGIRLAFGQYTYGLLNGSFSYYIPLDLSDNLRSNFRFLFQPAYVYQLDSASPVPYWKRLSLGNQYFMKGYSNIGERISPSIPVLISPVTGQTIDLLSGGNRSFYGNLEYFLPIIPEAKLRLVSFLEAGTVLDDYDSFSLAQVKYDVGFGFRWQTPIAPFRFEWAFPVEQGKLGDVHFVFSVGLDNFGS